MINLFTYGMSGAGKDTLANYFQDNHLYLKFRCAGTMKQIISEKNKLGYSQLELDKRTNEALRKEHWKVGDWLGKDGSAVKQRLINIINRDSVEFDIMPKNVKNNGIIICDVRRLFEAELLLQSGFVGIFLSRTNSEYKPNKHTTEVHMFENGYLQYLVNKYPKQCIIVINSMTEEYNREQIEKMYGGLFENALNIISLPKNSDGDALVKVFKDNLTVLIPNFFNGNNSETLLM